MACLKCSMSARRLILEEELKLYMKGRELLPSSQVSRMMKQHWKVMEFGGMSENEEEWLNGTDIALNAEEYLMPPEEFFSDYESEEDYWSNYDDHDDYDEEDEDEIWGRFVSWAWNQTEEVLDSETTTPLYATTGTRPVEIVQTSSDESGIKDNTEVGNAGDKAEGQGTPESKDSEGGDSLENAKCWNLGVESITSKKICPRKGKGWNKMEFACKSWRKKNWRKKRYECNKILDIHNIGVENYERSLGRRYQVLNEVELNLKKKAENVRYGQNFLDGNNWSWRGRKKKKNLENIGPLEGDNR
ncbi:unnamed protein product [Blepharisma stoltei]|uniref:Uncharacterized protein n=1 Tax=Blepharisma stoltei TaxID=1481888 RepID=A0AAU9K4V2_9CILI|nr:unnamed protein product [Blepharisma stoltei]